jgi:hypothetical protein
MAKKQFNIETRLTADIDQLQSKLKTANKKVEHFKNQAKKQSGDIFGTMTKSVGGLLPAIGLASAGVEVFQGVINTTILTIYQSIALTILFLHL